ncbi:MAG: hypothetical protein QG652_1214 [Pseudomonadota bacterium]|nr:hypothetical protein [Pseudomonadota bacterium]
MEAAFLQGAGFSADSLNLFIRGMLVSLYFLWTAWSCWKQFGLVRKGRLEVNEFMNNTLVALGVLTFIMFLVTT